MKIHNLNFEYILENRLPNVNLEKLVKYLIPYAKQDFTVAIYGMADAGCKIYERFQLDKRINVVACFDVNPGAVNNSIAVHKPEQISDFLELDMIINTAPPQYVFDICKFISERNSYVDILNLYDAGSFFGEVRNWDCMYKAWINDCDFNALIKDYHKQVFDFVNIEKHQLLETTRVSRTRSVDTIMTELIGSKKCLGRYLDSAFEEILKEPEDCIQKLIELANEYPFFTIARDAAATILVKEGYFNEAVKAFEPSVEMYPCCRFTLSKLSELKVLCGDFVGAEQAARAALSLSPDSSEILGLIRQIENKQKKTIKEKWLFRKIRPQLKARNVGLRCAIPVWGRRYIKTFMEQGLGSLLASGNIPYVAKDHDVCFSIYAYEEECDYVKSFPQWAAVSSIVPAELISIESVLEKNKIKYSYSNKYSHMSICQNDALFLSAKDGKATFMPLADFVFSNNYLKEAIERIDMGYDTIFSQAFRVSTQGFAREVFSDFAKGPVLELPIKDMLAAGARNMHPFSSRAKDSSFSPISPNYFVYEDKSGNIIHSVFGSNPLLIYNKDNELQIDTTLDGDLPYRTTDGGLGRYFFSDDSEDMLFFEVVDEKEELNRYIKKCRNLKRTSYWLHGSTDPMRRFLGTRLVLYKNNNISFEKEDEFYQAVVDTLKMVL